MGGWLLKLLGMKVAKHALRGRSGRAPFIDIGLGFALLRDGRVPARSKIAALGLGGVVIAALLAVEAPVEALIGLLLNVPGIGLDMMVDGLEILAGPVLVACLMLPRLVSARLADQLRAERGGPVLQEAYATPQSNAPPNYVR